MLNETIPTTKEDIDFFKNMQTRSDELRREIKKTKNTIDSF